MTRWRYIVFYIIVGVLYPFNSIAFEMPYGVQDPFKSPGFPACKGGEQGFWNVIKRTIQGKEVIFLLLTTVDVADPAYAICWQPGEHRIMAMGPETKL